MRLAARLTLDGLVRALRAHAHRVADEIEDGRTGRRDRFRPDDERDGRPKHGTGADGDGVTGD